MKALALELSSGRGSIAWLENGADLFVQEFANDRKHSGLFFESLENSIARFGKADRIVVGLGPGSYAGTRIAIATALGLQAATGAELLGLPSLCAMPTDQKEYAVVGDARRQSYYFARISERRCIEGPVICTPEELQERIPSLATSIFSTEALPTIGDVIINYPCARILAQIATRDAISETSTPLEPMYLREPHITEPRNLAR